MREDLERFGLKGTKKELMENLRFIKAASKEDEESATAEAKQRRRNEDDFDATAAKYVLFLRQHHQ